MMRSAPWRLQALLLLLIPLCSIHMTGAFITWSHKAAKEGARIINSRVSATVTPDMLSRTSPTLRRKEIGWPKLEDLTGGNNNNNNQATSSTIVAPSTVDVSTVFREELPSFSIDSLPSRVFQEEPRAVYTRIQFLKASMPGVNVTSAVTKLPRLISYYGQEAEIMEARVKQTFTSLLEVMHMQYVGDFVSQSPRVLLRDFETRIKPFLEMLNEALPGCDGAYLVRKHPAILSRGIEKHLKPRLAVLPTIFPMALTPENVTALVSNYPELLTVPIQEVTTRLQALSSLLPHDLLLPTLVRHPRAWTADLKEEVGPQVTLLRKRLGEETARSILLNLPSAMYHIPTALEGKLDLLADLLGSAQAAEAVINRNPMILAMDTAANVAPKIRYVKSLFEQKDQDSFVAMLATEAGSKCLTAAFGRLGRLSYLLQVQPGLDIAKGMRLVVCSSEELRRMYPGYENFLEEAIEPRFPNYTWEQLCALPFSLREQAHGELLHNFYSGAGSLEGGIGEITQDMMIHEDHHQQQQEQLHH